MESVSCSRSSFIDHSGVVFVPLPSNPTATGRQLHSHDYNTIVILLRIVLSNVRIFMFLLLQMSVNLQILQKEHLTKIFLHMVIPELIHMKIGLLCLGILYLVISLCEMMCNHKESIHNTLQGSVVDTMKVSKNIFSARYF